MAAENRPYCAFSRRRLGRTGTVEIGGHDLLEDPRAVRRLLGVVFQKPALDRKMSVRENLVAAGQLYGMARRDIDARIRGLLEGLKLKDRLDEKVEALSGGLARRVELAKALLPEPQVLILDEPTTGLDPISRQEFWNEVNHLRGEGTTVLVTTHLLDEAAAAIASRSCTRANCWCAPQKNYSALLASKC